MATEAELAWAAGLFDGEGSLGVYRHTQYHGGKKYVGLHLIVKLAMCNQQAVEKFGEIVGEGKVNQSPRPTNSGRLVWTWNTGGVRAGLVLTKLLPYLVVKREQAELGLVFRAIVRKNSRGLRTPPELIQRQSEIADSIKQLKLVS